MRSLLLSLVLLAACGPDVNVTPHKVDKDGDGYAEDIDCDDTHATVNPDADEVCDGADNNCDGAVDEDASDAPTWYADADGDGFGDGSAPTLACEAAAGTVADATDCDDTVAIVYPGADEVCDELDNDCDGEVDDEPNDLATFYVDADGDGYGDPATAIEACEPGTGEVSDGTDCDDDEAAIHPDAAEEDCTDPTDYNCDGSVGYADADGDGAPACGDCDDANAGRSPALTEVCDELDVDEDCDGVADDGDDSATGLATWGRDTDSDGYSGSGATIEQCEQPAGYAAATGDCDDYDTAVNPGALEVCDALDTDEDCDGAADDADASVDASTWTTFYADRDGDTYGDATRTATQCQTPSSYVTNADDCDDTTAARNPGEVEVCDAADLDEDCDSLADDDDSSVTGGTTWHADADGDGYGGESTVETCAMPSGYVANSEDCDDAAASVSPAATEVCDSANTDEDCDGAADDADSSVTGTSTWYLDADSDGYGSTTSVSTCEEPSGYVTDATDCDDAEADAYPGGTEVCEDGIDQDCSGEDDSCPRYAGSYDVDSDYDTKLYGVATSDRFGDQLVAGDFNGDGAGDLVVAAIDNQYSTQEGTVYGYYGPFPAGAASATANDDFLWYNTNSDYASLYGGRLYNLGDVNGDGNDDLLVSLDHSTTWLTYLYLGGDTGTVPYTTERDATLGCSSAAAAGDFDATSGNDEWICGYSTSNTYTGVAYVFTGTSTTATATFTGEDTYDYVGKSVAGGGDVDGDGYDDVWIGAYMDDTTATEAGAVYLLYGPVSGTMSLASADAKIRGDAYQDYLGNNMTMPGDVDGDGLDDLVATAHLNDVSATNAGAVYVFTAPVTGTAASQAHAIVRGEDASDQLGWNASTGDFDGDGEIDLFVGSHFNDDAATDAGSTWLVYGPLTGTTTLASADAEWLGQGATDYFGYRYAAVPDTDGDGSDELAMAAIYGDEGSSGNQGAVWIWLGM